MSASVADRQERPTNRSRSGTNVGGGTSRPERPTNRSRSGTNVGREAADAKPGHTRTYPSPARRSPRPAATVTQTAHRRNELRQSRHVRLVDLLLRAGPPRERQRRVGQRPRGRRGPRAGSRPRATASSTVAVAGHDVVGLLDERLEAVERGEVGARASRPARASGSRPATGSRRTRARAPTGSNTAVPSAVWPSAGCSSSSWSPSAQWPGHRQRLRLRQPQRPRALDVVLLVELAHRALHAAGLVAQPRARSTRRRRAARRGTRSGRARGPSRRA